MKPVNRWTSIWVALRSLWGSKNFVEMTKSEKGRAGEKEGESYLKKKVFASWQEIGAMDGMKST